MTLAEFRNACAAYQPTAPVTLADCREIYADLKPQLTAGIPLDVMLLGTTGIRVTVGEGAGTYRIDLQAQ